MGLLLLNVVVGCRRRLRRLAIVGLCSVFFSSALICIVCGPIVFTARNNRQQNQHSMCIMHCSNRSRRKNTMPCFANKSVHFVYFVSSEHKSHFLSCPSFWFFNVKNLVSTIRSRPNVDVEIAQALTGEHCQNSSIRRVLT